MGFWLGWRNYIKHGGKRVYQSVTISNAGELLLDNTPALTIEGNVLSHVSNGLMQRISAEWQAQTNTINFFSMPLTRLLCSVVDQNDNDKIRMISEIIPYAQGDTLRYQATKESALHILQQEIWNPWLSWANKKFLSEWTFTNGISPIATSLEMENALEKWLLNLKAEQLLAMHIAVHMLGSFIIASAFILGECSAQSALEIAFLEQTFQMRIWGEDQDFLDKQSSRLKELNAVDEFLKLAH